MPRRLAIVAAMLGLLLGLGSPAQAATTTFRVSPLGAWTSPATGNISGNATCDGGVGLITFTTLTGTPYTVSGQTEVVCDGASHTWAATIVGGPWARGQAITFGATLTAPSGTAFQVPKVVLL
jgi:hypothetical protein